MYIAKGEKDRFDILALLQRGIDFLEYKKLLKKYDLSSFHDDLHHILQTTRKVPELNINEHAFSVLKKEILKQLK